MFYSSLLLSPTLVETDKSAYLNVPGYKDMITPEQIIWIEGDGNYSRIHLTNGKQLVITQTLTKFEYLIPSFIRTHKSSMINPNHVKNFRLVPRNKTGLLVLTGGFEIFVARRRFYSVLEGLNQPDVAKLSRLQSTAS